jgi:hypothetical protein
MLGRHKLLLLIPAILLIPILLGMTPLNMGHRLASGGPFTHAKQCCWDNHCPFHSLTSHHDLAVGILGTSPLVQESLPVQEFEISLLESVHSNINLNSTHLRC